MSIDQLPRLASGLSAMLSLGLVFLAPTGLTRGMAAVACLGSVLSLGIQKPKSDPQQTPLAPVQPNQAPQKFSNQYQSIWTVDIDQKQRQFIGEATVMSWGDQIVVKQDEAEGGSYVIELKAIGERQVSGIWWFYGGGHAHGLYRGTISDDGKEIMGMWQGPNGNGSGQWNLIAGGSVAQPTQPTLTAEQLAAATGGSLNQVSL